MDIIEKNKTALSFAAVIVFGAAVFAATAGPGPATRSQDEPRRVVTQGDEGPAPREAAPVTISFDDMIGEYQAEGADTPPESRDQPPVDTEIEQSASLPPGVNASDLPPGLPPFPANSAFRETQQRVAENQTPAASQAPISQQGESIRARITSRAPIPRQR